MGSHEIVSWVMGSHGIVSWVLGSHGIVSWVLVNHGIVSWTLGIKSWKVKVSVYTCTHVWVCARRKEKKLNNVFTQN